MDDLTQIAKEYAEANGLNYDSLIESHQVFHTEHLHHAQSYQTKKEYYKKSPIFEIKHYIHPVTKAETFNAYVVFIHH